MQIKQIPINQGEHLNVAKRKNGVFSDSRHRRMTSGATS